MKQTQYRDVRKQTIKSPQEFTDINQAYMYLLIDTNPLKWNSIPDWMKTEEFILKYLIETKDFESTKHLLTQEIVNKYLDITDNLKDIPIHFRTIKMYLFANKNQLRDKQSRIILDLLSGKTIQEVSDKYQENINKIIEPFAGTDIYDVIQNTRETYEIKKIKSIYDDIDTLEKTIEIIGQIDYKLNQNQKIIFSYHCQDLSYSLGETFEFIKQNCFQEHATITQFLKKYLGYRYNSSATNNWLDEFNIAEYFKNPELIHKRLDNNKQEHIIDFETMETVLKILKDNNLPISNIIVNASTQHYINNTLETFIEDVKTNFEKPKEKRKKLCI